MKVAIAGSVGLGAFTMRGLPLLQLGYDLIDLTKPTKDGRWDTIILVKYDRGYGKLLRKNCSRFIYDPLDAWSIPYPNARPHNFWAARKKELQFDTIISTSPSATSSMSEAIDPEMIITIKHHHDKRIVPSYDKNGPIVYVGGTQYLGNQQQAISAACQKIGKKFIVGNKVNLLRGASLAVAVRLPPTNTQLNMVAKPGVKLENAAAANLPILASDHQCITSLRPESYCIPDNDFDWLKHIERALESTSLNNPMTEANYLEQMSNLINE